MNCSRCSSHIPDGRLQCPKCKQVQTRVAHGGVSTLSSGTTVDESITLDKAKSADVTRIISGPWDYCFGGGLVLTSCALVGGAPGAGKSTLFLQMAGAVALKLQDEVCYIATEESINEIKARADRLKVPNQNKIRMISAMGGMPNVGAILAKHKPKGIWLDSLQGLAGESEAASLEFCRIMKQVAVNTNAPVIISSHVNKSDEIAGLMANQHVVDSIHTFFPDQDGVRIWEVEKNRHGRAFISTTYEMTETGLEVLELEADKQDRDSREYETEEDEEE